MTLAFTAAIEAFSPALPMAVAYSGGADSTALLLACSQKWSGQVYAIHIHHGLQAAADGFEQHCRAFCTQLGVPLAVRHVNAGSAPGQSPEDAARRARYAAIKAVALEEYAQAAIQSIAIAQHADDQVETLLLALSRGGGLPGLSAMPAHWVREGLHYHRPLLAVSSTDIRGWLSDQSASFIEDPTNSDQQFTRNRIRAQLLPVLAQSFPKFRDTFARSIAHCAQAQSLLLELAVQDLALVGVPPAVTALQRLSQPRQANALRHWLKENFNAMPSAAQLDELLRQIAACTTRGHHIQIKVGSGVLERQGKFLHWYNPPVLR